MALPVVDPVLTRLRFTQGDLLLRLPGLLIHLCQEGSLRASQAEA